MDSPDPFLRFSTTARAFLARAEENLARFERDHSAEFFFYAALELRYGIEARLNEYLGPALSSIGKDPKSISHYVASKLLKQLVSVDPDAGRGSTVRLTGVHDGHTTTLQYMPVSQRLAAIHGQLGELLHYKFFADNEHWALKKPLGGNPHRSLADFRPLLDEGIVELRRATSGSLLSNPRFTELVQSVVNDAAGEPDVAND